MYPYFGDDEEPLPLAEEEPGASAEVEPAQAELTAGTETSQGVLLGFLGPDQP